RFEIAPDGHDRFVWRGTFEHDGTRWTLAATTGDPAAALRSRIPFEIDARLEGAGASLTAQGRAEPPDTGPAAVLGAARAWAAGRRLGAGAAPARGAGRGRLAAGVAARDGRYALGGMAGAGAGTKVDGNREIDTTGKVPRIAGRLHADTVDLAHVAA